MPSNDRQTTADIVDRLRETLTGEDTDEAMWRRIYAERREAAGAIEMLRIQSRLLHQDLLHMLKAAESVRTVRAEDANLCRKERGE